MNRRDFNRISATLLGGLAWPRITVARRATFARHLAGKVVSAPDLPIPPDMRAPFGWRTVAVTANHPPVVCAWPDLAKGVRPTHLRFSVGLDERDEKTAEVFLPKSGRLIGSVELKFVSRFQIYQLPLTAADVAAIRREGVALRLTKGSDLEILAGGSEIPAVLLPHLLLPGAMDAKSEYYARLNSLACVQPFGWMEGCVLDGLLDLAATPRHAQLKSAAQRHLALFFQGDRLVYENHVSAPSDDKLYGIEAGLPFAALARLEPHSPLLDLAVRFWESRKRPNGLIQDAKHLSSEGAYTVGYALAEIAKAHKSEELMQLALTQVRLRQQAFFDGKEFWRTRDDLGRGGNRNWARGIAWQMLGLARTLTVAKDRSDIVDLIDSLRQISAWAMTMQCDDGLWSVFTDEPALKPDTAGSAGIAAALAIGAKHGWLDAAAQAAAARTLAGLEKHLTPDGLLGGVSQSNKGGEALQRSDFRCIYQMGMGLMAQLDAALQR
jgi:unsaturated rhamnogalacturonyl hydrolase